MVDFLSRKSVRVDLGDTGVEAEPLTKHASGSTAGFEPCGLLQPVSMRIVARVAGFQHAIRDDEHGVSHGAGQVANFCGLQPMRKRARGSSGGELGDAASRRRHDSKLVQRENGRIWAL